MFMDLNIANAFEYCLIAETYNLSKLKGCARRFFALSTNSSNVFDRYEVARENGYTEIEEDLIEFMKSTVNRVVRSTYFFRLDPKLRKELLNLNKKREADMSCKPGKLL
jgi:hypothetical protein